MSGQVIAISEKVVAKEVAEHELQRFIEAMDLDVDPKGMDDDDRKSLEDAKRKLIRAMQDGQLVIDEHGQPVFTPQLGNVSPITFHEPTGASLMAMDSKKRDHTVGKTFATMADITREPAQRFAVMSNRDVKVCLAITALFLG